MSGEVVVVSVLILGVAVAVEAVAACRSKTVRRRALRATDGDRIHFAAKSVALLSLAVVVGIYLDGDASALGEIDIYYYATYAAYVGGGMFLLGYAAVEVIAAIEEISHHPDYGSQGETGAIDNVRRSEAVFADWRYLVNEYHGGAILAFWVSGGFLLLGGFLGLVEGSVPVTVISVLSMGLGTAAVVAGALVGWTRRMASIEEEADDAELVDEIVEEARGK